MFPTVVEFEGTQMPIRQFIYNEAIGRYSIQAGSENNDRSHLNPVTDTILSATENFPSGSIVVTYDPINQETVNVPEPLEHICSKINAAGECCSSDSDENISSDPSDSEDTPEEKRMINKRVLKRVKIISEKLKYFNENTRKQTGSLIRSNNRERLWRAHVIENLERVVIEMGPE